jgi:hypothetical protein
MESVWRSLAGWPDVVHGEELWTDNLWLIDKRVVVLSYSKARLQCVTLRPSVSLKLRESCFMFNIAKIVYYYHLNLLNFTFVWLCFVTNFFLIKPTSCTNFTYLFWHETLHVSDSSSVHHQELIHCTLINGICHTGTAHTTLEQDLILLESCLQTYIT